MNNDWQPSASIKTLKLRAKYLVHIRDFFAKKGLIEVETPLLYPHPVTDPYLDAYTVKTHLGYKYLQTSPEYAMKRLLAAGSGSIYQITKAFRDEEQGSHHNPEFTIIEWYKIGFDHFMLMEEISELFQSLKPDIQIVNYTYQQLFEKYCGFDPHTISPTMLKKIVIKNIGLIAGLNNPSKDDHLNLLLTHIIEPKLAQQEVVFIYHYPKSQAALAKIDVDSGFAERFEVYYKGIELANGYHELTDATIQRQRFNEDLKIRIKEKSPQVPIDNTLLLALEHGLPECAGVALGFDRLIMALENLENINQVIAFPFKN